MKKRVLTVAVFLATNFVVNAQVGIGTLKPNKSAELTIESTNKGMLIPRIALKNSKDVVTIHEFPEKGINSMLVYNTATVENDLKPGYYYWYIDKWNRLTSVSDIPGIVINNYQEIFNNENIKKEIINIINKLEGEYGNVSYDTDKNQFFYIKDGKVEYINWSNLDTVNISFAIDANKENLVITDSQGGTVSLSVDALGETIAKNDVFVTNLTENSEFVTKLVENKEFITKLG
ncbi:hypothetical protein VSP10_11825, partial [Myroides odoratimimus]|nr:hypothetical protein [Myroides odoratimimus]